MGKSSRAIQRKNVKEIEESEISFPKSSKSDYLKKSNKNFSPKTTSFHLTRWLTIAGIIFILLLFTGIFSPAINPGSNEFIKNENLPENTFTNEHGEKLSIVLYSSPTCGCCHEYVDYLNDNNFDTFQKRTQDYITIKDTYMVPKDQRSCHTAIIDDYFIEGHIPLSVVFNLLADAPDIDGISLPGMPDGSPGMPGDKNEDWVVSSILNGHVIGVFATV